MEYRPAAHRYPRASPRTRAAVVILAVLAHVLLILLIVRLTATREKPWSANPEIVVRLTLAQRPTEPAVPPIQTAQAPPPPSPAPTRPDTSPGARRLRGPAIAPAAASAQPTDSPAQTSDAPGNPATASDAAAGPPLDISRGSIRGALSAMDHEEAVLASSREPEGRLLQKKLAKKTVETDFAAGVKRAERPDCRKAYAAYGPLGLPLLIIDTATDHGCKW